MVQPHGRITPAKILIVDDQEANVQVLERMLQREGYHNIRSTTDSRETLALFADFEPHLILLDLVMPHLTGLEVMKLLRPRIPSSMYLPILVLTADVTLESKRQAL